MDQPGFAADDLTYPGARVLDAQEHGGVHNLLLASGDDIGKVWRWYARRLGAGSSPVAAGEREFDAGTVRVATRGAVRRPWS